MFTFDLVLFRYTPGQQESQWAVANAARLSLIDVTHVVFSFGGNRIDEFALVEEPLVCFIVLQGMLHKGSARVSRKLRLYRCSQKRLNDLVLNGRHFGGE